MYNIFLIPGTPKHKKKREQAKKIANRFTTFTRTKFIM